MLNLRLHTKYLLAFAVLLTVTSFFVYYNKSLESFTISPINSYEVNPNTLDIHKTIEVSRDIYSSALQKTFPQGQLIDIMDTNKIYAENFVLKSLLEKIVKDELNTRFSDSPIEVSEIQRVGWDDKTKIDSVIFNFNIDLINRRVMWVIPIKAWVQLDINNICNSSAGCVETISQLLNDNLINTNEISKSFKLIGVQIDNMKQYEIKPIDSSSPNYFQIKNTLFLTEPFLTSGEKMRL